MSASIVTIAHVFLKPEHLRHSAHHRAMAPAPTQPDTQPGADQGVIVLEFWGGVARNVPKNEYELFAKLGIATDQRPLTRWERELQHGRAL